MKFSVAIAGDAHFKKPEHIKPSLETISEGVDMVILNGDTLDVPTEEMLSALSESTHIINKPIKLVLGNHESSYQFQDATEAFIRCFGNPQYSFMEGGCYFIVMDYPTAGDLPVEWLLGESKRSKGYKHCFLFSHSPLKPISPGGLIKKDEDRINVFTSVGVSCFFFSHSHFHIVKRWGNIPMVLTGSLHDPPYQYTVLSINSGGWSTSQRYLEERG